MIVFGRFGREFYMASESNTAYLWVAMVIKSCGHLCQRLSLERFLCCQCDNPKEVYITCDICTARRSIA